MTTLVKRGSGTPATGGLTAWTNLTNAVDGTPPANPATYAVWTNAASGGSGYIEISGYDFSAIADTDTLNSVTVSVRNLVSTTGRFSKVEYQAWSGGVALGTIRTGTLNTAAHDDSGTFACTLAQLKAGTFKVRVTFTRAAVTQSATASVDHADVTADYTINPPAVTQAAYRFYADGTEAGSTALAAPDTTPTVDTSAGDVNLQVRTRLQSTNTIAIAATDDWQLQWERNTSGTWTGVLPATALVDSSELATSYLVLGNVTAGYIRAGQSFLGNGGQLSRASFRLYREGSPVTDVTAALYAHTGTFGTTSTGTGSALARSAVQAAGSLSTGPPSVWVDFEFAGTTVLTAGTPYVITVEASGLTSPNFVRVAYTSSAGHAGNGAYYDTAWTSTTSETCFRVYTGGGSTAVPYASANLTDGAATTNRLGAGTGSFVAGKVSEDGLIDDLGWSANNYTEVLYSVTLKQADLAPTDTLRFRVLRNGATTGLTYTQVPTVTIGAGGPTDRTGTATGSLSLSGVAAGGVGVTGTATGSLSVVGVAAGAPVTPGLEVTGTAAGSLTISGVAAGAPGVVATATGAVAVAGVASGIKSVTATATGSLTLSASALGVPGVLGVASSSLSIAGTAAGIVTRDVLGTAVGALTVVGVVSGVPGVTATATGSLAISGVAVGTAGVVATATGSLAVTGTATGVRGTPATATGHLSISGTASATKQVTGSATGQVVLSSQALGLVEGNAVGTAVGALTIAGTASGVRSTAGTATGQITLSATVVGRRNVTATATGQLTLAATATAITTVTARATGSLTISGTATGSGLTVSSIIGEWNDSDVVAMQYGDDAVVEWFMLMATQVNATATGGLILGGAATATVDVPGTATGTLTIIALAAGIIETPAGPCTEVLSEPFDHLAAWSSLSLATIVAGRTGNGLQITGAGAAVHLFAANESAHLTCGFAYQVSNLAAARSILVARSDNGATTQLTFMVTTGGAIEVRRGGTSGTVLGTTATGLVAATTWVYIEMQVFLDDTAGTVVVNTGGTQRLSIGPLDTRFGGTEAVLDGIGLGASSGANTLFDDLYLTTGSGCPFQGDHTVASTVSFRASLGQAVATTSGTTLVITTTAAIAGGDLVVVRVASDNLNATTPTFTAADSGGNSYTTHAQKAINATAALGIAGAVICSRATNPIAAGGTITVTLSGAVAARAAYAESFAGYINTTRSTPVTASAASATPNTLPSGTVNAGDLVVAACAVETRTAPTGDADTTGGTPWSTLVQLPNTGAGTDTDAVLISGQHKIAALSGAQTYNQTTVNTDWAAMVVVLQRA